MNQLDRTIACNSIIEKLDILLQQVECGSQPAHGICYAVERGLSRVLGDNVPGYITLWQERSPDAFEVWPHFSGSYSWPVPVTDDDCDSPCMQYAFASRRWEGKQLELRLSLLRHLIEYFEELGHASISVQG